jgi:hypothetical protein
VAASARKLPDGRYEVTLVANANKVRADELGAEKDVPLRDYIYVGVDDREGRPLVRQRLLVERKHLSVTMVVQGRPAKAGIDPDNKLIDRKPSDNLIDIEYR